MAEEIPKRKEDTKQVANRVKRFKEKHGYTRLQIYVTKEIKQSFDNLPGLTSMNNTEKLEVLINY